MPEVAETKSLEPKSSTSENLISEAYFGTTEKTYFKSPLVGSSYLAPYNQDDLWQKTGDYSIYEEMLQDDQVSICSKLKKDLILGSGFEIVQDGDDEQEDVIEELYKSLNSDVEGQLLNRLEEMLNCYDFGFSLTEKIFQKKSDGSVTLKQLKTRHPNSWLIHQDDHGNITKFEQNTNAGNINVPAVNLVHMIANEKFQNPYGTSDLRTCYAAWFAKRQVIRFYAIFLEKAASPTPVARYNKDAPQGAVDKIFNIIKKFQAKTAIVIPKEIELEFLEAKSAGEAYSKALNIFNMFIGRSMFVPDLLGLSGSETGGGSYSLGKDQIKIFFMHINRRRAYLEAIIQKHIIEPICRYNYGEMEYYPCFRFKPLDDSEAVELAKVWLEAVKSKVFKPNDAEINYFRSLCKFPEGDVEFEQSEPELENTDINEANQPQMEAGVKLPDTGGQKVSDTALNGAQVTALVEVVEAVAVGRLPRESAVALIESAFLVEKAEAERILGPAGKGFEPEDKLAQQGVRNSPQEFAKVFNLPKGNYHKKCDFKAIEAKFNDYDKSIMNEARPVIKKIYNDLYDQLAKKKIIEKKDIEKVETIQLKYLKELKTILKSSFMGIYKDGQVQANSELFKSNFRQPTTSQEFLDLLEKENFNYIGDWQYNVTKAVRQQLIIAIKEGKPLSEVINILDSEGRQLSEISLERYARTKHTEVMNRGRLEAFESSGVVTGYQYSAILDDRTSEICRGLDGKIFPAGKEVVPPMHFNCRSLLVPITKYEEFEPDTHVGKTPISDFVEENKGAGFATK